MHQALNQFYRVQRWHERLKRIHAKEPAGPHVTVAMAEDDIYAFFINCHGLKDWIRNDPKLKGTHIAQQVMDYIIRNVPLAVCGDLSNGLKHFKLNPERFPPLSKQPVKRNIQQVISIYPDIDPIYEIHMEIDCELGKISYMDLADKCLALWVDFFEKNGIQIKGQSPRSKGQLIIIPPDTEAPYSKPDDPTLSS